MNVINGITLIVSLILITCTLSMNHSRLGIQAINSESLLFDQNAAEKFQKEIEQPQKNFNHIKVKRSNGNMGMRGRGIFKRLQTQNAFIPPGQYKHFQQQQQQRQNIQQFQQQYPQQSLAPIPSNTILVQTIPINDMQLPRQQQQQTYIVSNQVPTNQHQMVRPPQVIVVEQPLPLSRQQLTHENRFNVIQPQHHQQQQQQPQNTVILVSQVPPQQVYQVPFAQQQQQQQQQQQLLLQPQLQPSANFHPLAPVSGPQNHIVVTTIPENRFTLNGQNSVEKYEQQQLVKQISETIKKDQQWDRSSLTNTNEQDKSNVEMTKNPNQLQQTHQAIITQSKITATTTTTMTTTTPNPRLYDLLYGSNLNSDQQKQQQQQQKEEESENIYEIDPRIKQ